MKASTRTALYAGGGTVVAILLGGGIYLVTKDDETPVRVTPRPRPRPRPRPKPRPKPPGPDGIPPPHLQPKPLKPGPSPTPSPPPKPPKPKPSPEKPPSKPPTGSTGTSKFSRASASERRNAAFAVEEQPSGPIVVMNGPKPVTWKRKPGQSLRYWLADVAYAWTYPKGPKKLDKKAHPKWVAAYVRILNHVDRMLKIWGAGLKSAKNPVWLSSPIANTHRSWRRWALALAVSSDIRTLGGLRNAYKDAFWWLMKSPEGRVWFGKHQGKRYRGSKATTDALMGESAVIIKKAGSWPEAQRQFADWTGKKPSRAYFATRGTAVG